MCHWACHVQFEYSWEDKQYLGTCEFLTQPPDCRSRSPSLNQLPSEWLKSDPGKKKNLQRYLFPLIHCQRFSLQQEELVHRDGEARIWASNIAAGKLKCEIMLLMSLRQLTSHYLLSEKLEKQCEEEEPVLPVRQFCLLMNLYEWKEHQKQARSPCLLISSCRNLSEAP